MSDFWLDGTESADTFNLVNPPNLAPSYAPPTYEGFYVTLKGGADQLTYFGNTHCFAFGGEGDDRLVSKGSGVAVLLGQQGDDTLTGGWGNDTLAGGVGHDNLQGGGGIDTFSFALADSTVEVAGRDSILDFQTGTDKVDLKGIDANTKVSGDQAFKFIGTADFHGKAGELQAKDYGSNTLISGDINGDSSADFSIVVRGHVDLHSGDFIL